MCSGYEKLLSNVFGAEEYIYEVIFAKYCTFICVFLKFVQFLYENILTFQKNDVVD